MASNWPHFVMIFISSAAADSSLQNQAARLANLVSVFHIPRSAADVDIIASKLTSECHANIAGADYCVSHDYS